jgi:CHAT domain-containing protein
MAAWIGILASPGRAAEETLGLAQARELQSAGRPEAAIPFYVQALDAYQSAGDTHGRVTAAVGLAGAYQALGQFCSATTWLESMLPVAEASGSQALRLQVESALGNVYLSSRRWEAGERLLRSSVALARQTGDPRARAGVQHNLANLLVAKEAGPARRWQKNVRGFIVSEPPPAAVTAFDEAMTLYGESARVATDLDAQDLLVKIKLNQARALLLGRRAPEARALCQEAWERLQRQTGSSEKVLHLVACGQLAAELAGQVEAEHGTLMRFSVEAYQAAIELGEQLGAIRPTTFAYGLMGELYWKEARLEEAMRLTQKALFLAQQGGIAEARFQWEWQAARILAAQGQTEKAIEIYRQAVGTVHALRSDFALSLAMRGVRQSFRQSLGQVYFELADLLLRRVDRAASEKSGLPDLLEARATVEMLKAVELEDYFMEDDCASLLRTKARSIDTVGPGVAAVYVIPLADRTELLLTLPSGLKRVVVAVGAEALAAQVRRLRNQLEDPDSTGYVAEARRLWEWLLAPVEGLLQAEQVKTLVFIPDGALRTIPMAALSDGTTFLIEKYAISVAPGLSLMKSDDRTKGRRSVLLCGVSQAVQGYPALDFVPAELASIAATQGGRRLLDQEFTTGTFERELRAAPFSIVHVASHGEFGSDASRTYILTYDGKLTLDRLEALILPRMLSERPIELLTLSACQTAAGDDRAALGLAGVAVKSGARSALATLWYINDEAAQRIMSSFYATLKNSPDLSKAEALRRAQRSLLGESRFRHPCFWSPYLLIGNGH